MDRDSTALKITGMSISNTLSKSHNTIFGCRRARLINVIWNLCPWQLLKARITFSLTIDFCLIHCKPLSLILLPMTVPGGSQIWQASLISSSEYYSGFSKKWKAMDMAENQTALHCSECLLRFKKQKQYIPQLYSIV